MRPAAARERGFNLLEVLTALAVLAVLTAMALPSVAHLVDRQRLHTAAETLAADLAEARFEAARRGQPLHLSFVTGAEWCWALASTPGCDCRGGPGCTLHAARGSQWPGIGLADSTDTVFDPTGTVHAATAVASFVSPRGERLRVVMSPLGRARVCAPDGPVQRYAAC
jgi:type IV fimbrial biogenesis protein FimT